jgi:hypothetical protein
MPEVTRNEAIRQLLVDEELSDLSLRSKIDGTVVLAHRAMLAVRSQVFRSMLYGKFAESSQSIIELPYPGDTIKALVDFVYNDNVLVAVKTKFNKEDNSEESSKKDFHVAKTIVSTIEAAKYYDLPTFQKGCEAVAVRFMNEKPMICVHFILLCEGNASLRWSETDKYAEEQIRLSPELLFENKKLAPSLSYKRIESFVHDRSIRATEYELFCLIQAWANESDNGSLSDEDLKSDPLVTPFDFEILNESRPDAAKKLVKHLDLSLIDPTELDTTITSSGFVDDQQLLEAFKAISLRAHRHRNVMPSFDRMVVWESHNNDTFVSCSKTHAVEKLKCPPLTRGITKWTILVVRACGFSSLGVASTVHEIQPDMFLGYQSGGWVAERFGRVAHHVSRKSNWKDTAGYLNFKKGSYVTFVLDLTGTGKLSGYVDGQLPAVILFSNMRAAFDSTATASFVPAVSLKSPGKVKFIGFQYDE